MEIGSGTILGRYKIESLLGSGGMGEVYLAQDQQLDRMVAVKILPDALGCDERRMRRFIQEAKAASALNHPNILTVHDIGQSGTTQFIATEFIDGQTLRERLNSGPMPVSESLDVAVQVASALAAAHAAGIIHRDIKPENVMLRRDGYVKVLDFGLAKLTDTHRSHSGEAATLIDTEPGMVLGTTNYMSPEQVRGGEVDRRTDIWSVGVVLHEMISGQKAFTASTPMDTLVRILEKDPASLPANAPDSVERIVRKALQKDPAERYSTAEELLADLKKADQGLKEGSQQQPTRIMQRAEIKRPLPTKWVAVAVLLLLVITLGYFARRRYLQSSLSSSSERFTLAILPFRPLNAHDEIGFLGVGIPDAIITKLANIQQIRLRPTNAILRYQNQDVNPQQVGQELSIDYLVTGTLQKADDRLRVQVQLIRASDGAPIWGDKFDNQRSDLLNLQDSIAQQIATALRVKMSAAEQERVYRRYTANAGAYEAYLKGRAELAHATQERTVSAVEAFELALTNDPNYTLARSGLAMACSQMHLYFATSNEVQIWGERAKREAQRALDEDPNLAETHQALAAVYGRTEFDWQRTISESSRALELNPSLDLSHYLRGRAFYHLGLFEEAIRDVQEGLKINPDPYARSENEAEAFRTKGNTAFLNGNFGEAVASLEEAHKRSAGAVSDWWLAQAYYYQGQKQRAIELLEELHRSSSASAATRARAIYASILAADNQRDRTNQVILEIRSAGYMDHHVAYSLGLAYAQMNQREQALEWIRQAAETGFPCYPWFERDPMLDPLRNDANFQSFMTQLRNTYETTKANYASLTN